MLNNNYNIMKRLDHSQSYRQRGMTLIELIVACAVVLILLTMGIPAVQNMTLNNRLITEANKMLSSLLLARSEAVKRRYIAKVCPSADSATCSSNLNAAMRLVFVDEDEDGVPDTEEILRIEKNLGSDQEWDGPTSVSFTPDGMTGIASTIDLKLEDSRKEADNTIGVKCIQIEVSGRPAIVDLTSDKKCPGF